MKKFPEVKMSEVAAVLSCQKDEERLQVLKQVVIRSLTDYYSENLCAKCFIFAVDPITSVQVAGRRHALITKRVREKFSLWWNVPVVHSQEIEEMYGYWQSRIEKINEYKNLLRVFNWYHFMVRYRINEALQNVESEAISLRRFLQACFCQFAYLQRQNINSFV